MMRIKGDLSSKSALKIVLQVSHAFGRRGFNG